MNATFSFIIFFFFFFLFFYLASIRMRIVCRRMRIAYIGIDRDFSHTGRTLVNTQRIRLDANRIPNVF